MEYVTPENTKRFLNLLNSHSEPQAQFLLVELFDSIPFNESSPFNSDFVFGIVSKCIPNEKQRDVMICHHWNEVCQKLISWNPSHALPLLDVLLVAMGEEYRLSYDFYVMPLAGKIVESDPKGAWAVITAHLEKSLPQWRTDVLHWLKGGLGSFDEERTRASISDIPISEIVTWIEKDPDARASLIAHAAPRTLENDGGGELTRMLLTRYGHVDGVKEGIGAIFHSGGWTGPASLYLKKQREKFRTLLSMGFESEVNHWIEAQIQYLDRQIEQEEIHEERSHFD